MHSSGSMISMRANSWMQSTGQTSTQDLSLMSMQGSAMMYVTRASLACALVGSAGSRAALLAGSGELCDEPRSALDERGFDDHLVETGRVRTLQAGLVRVVREPHDRDVRPLLDHFLGVDPRDVRDHEIRGVDAVGGDEAMAGQQPLELAPEEEIDPNEQDRRHPSDTSTARG